MSAENMNPEITGIESALRELQPGPSGLDRDRLMFLAGQACPMARPNAFARWSWPLATAALAVLSASLGMLAFQEREPRVVYVRAPMHVAQPKEGDSPDSSDGSLESRDMRSLSPPAEVEVDSLKTGGSYLALRRNVIERGWEAIPPPATVGNGHGFSVGDRQAVLEWIGG